MDTTLLATKILASGELNKEGYSLRELFRIRDCLVMLKEINPLFCDENLLQETLKYIKQKGE